MQFQDVKIDFLIRYNVNNKYTTRWSKASEFAISNYMDNNVLVPCNNLNELKSVTSNITNVNNLSATLYFHKSAVFPRYKLQDSQFKRCIKIEKADYIVISDEYKNIPAIPVFNRSKTCAIIKSGSYVYMVTEFALKHQSLEFLHDKLKTDLSYFDYYYPPKSEDLGGIEILYQGEVLELTEKDELLYLYTIGAIKKPFITDFDLDKTISSKLSEITWDDIVSIREMLTSSNHDSNALGLKLLAGFNVYSYPRTICTLLAITDKFWYRLNIPIIVQSMFNSLKYIPKGLAFPACLKYIKVSIKNDQDKEWSKKLIEDHVKEFVDNEVDMIKKRLNGTGFEIEINATIK